VVFREGLQTDPFFTKMEGRESFSGAGPGQATVDVFCMPVLNVFGVAMRKEAG
jgi:hypothetical protein